MKKFFKFVLWGLLVVIGVAGVGALATVISGGFNPKKIYINSLSINGEKEYVTISQNSDSFTGRVDFLPADANQLTLTTVVVTGKNVITEVPAITAGQNFTLKFAKDDNVVKGGEVEIKFVDSSNTAYTTLKLLVDVQLTGDHISIESGVTGLGKATADNKLQAKVSLATTTPNTIKISCDNKNMINSYKGSWSNSDSNTLINSSRMKKMLYYVNDVKSISISEVKSVNTDSEQYYLFNYYSTATTSAGSPAKLSVYIYRTYYMESVFSEDLFNSIVNSIENLDFSEQSLKYEQLNAFVNNYMYGACKPSQKEKLDKLINRSNGLVEFSVQNLYEDRLDALNEVLDFVFMHFDVEVSVKNIVVTKLNAPSDLNYRVLQDVSYSVDSLSDLGVSLSVETGTDPTILKNELRKIDIFAVEQATITNAESGKARIAEMDNTTQYENVDYFTIDGKTYNVLLNNNDYFYITKSTDNGEATWNLKTILNTPSTKNYALVYRYRNNEIDEIVLYSHNSNNFYKDSDNIWFEYKQGSGEESGKYSWEQCVSGDADYDAFITDYNKKQEGETVTTITETRYKYVGAEAGKGKSGWKQYNTSVNAYVDVTDNISMLNQLFQDQFAVVPITIEYTQGTISYTSTSEEFVLNTSTRIYKNDTNGNRVAETNLNYGAKRIVSSGSNSYVTVSPIDGTSSEMEYKTIKWLVRAEDNVILKATGDTQDTTYSPNNYYYKFLPAFDRTAVKKEDGSSEFTYLPRVYTLKDANGNEVKIGDDTDATLFMELGTDDFDLIALNVPGTSVVSSDASKGSDSDIDSGTDKDAVKMYPVVIQTRDTNGTEFYTDGTNGYKVYNAVAMDQGSAISLYVDNYIEQLYAYVRSSSLYTPGNSAGIEPGTLVEITGNQEKLAKISDSSAEIFISSMILVCDESGNVVTATTQNEKSISEGDIICYADGVLIKSGDKKSNPDAIVQEDSVNYKNNEKRALKNYRDTLSEPWSEGVGNGYSVVLSGGNDIGYQISDLVFPSDSASGGLGSASIDDYYLSFTISRSNQYDSGSGIVEIYVNGGSSSNLKYAYLPDGIAIYFKVEASTNGSEGSGGQGSEATT